MRELILVRHGQSEHHIRGWTGGWTNTRLTEFGRRQSQMTGERLHSLITAQSWSFYCSDLIRALETAKIIGSVLDLEPIADKALRELNWGVAKDMSLQEANSLKLEKTEPLIDWVPFPEAESRRMLFKRISKFLKNLVTNKEDRVLIVSHGNAIEECIFWWIELPLMFHSKISFDIDIGSISWLRLNDWHEKTIALLNSSDHLFSLASQT